MAPEAKQHSGRIGQERITVFLSQPRLYCDIQIRQRMYEQDISKRKNILGKANTGEACDQLLGVGEGVGDL